MNPNITTLDERVRRRAEMERLYTSGLSMREVGLRFGVSRARVSVILARPPRPYGRPSSDEVDTG